MIYNDIFRDWSNSYVGHEVVYMPPSWKSMCPIPYTFVYVDSELSCKEYIEFYKFGNSNNIDNPRFFSPGILEFASLFHPSFFHSVKNSSQIPTQFTKKIKTFKLTHPVSGGLDVPTTNYYLQSVIFLTGVTLSAAIVQNRWSKGTLESKLNRLWQAGSMIKNAGLAELVELDICKFVLKNAFLIEIDPLKALFELKIFYSKVLTKLAASIPSSEVYIQETKLTESQKLRFGFVNDLKSILGNNIQSIILYGSATNSKKFSDYDLIIVVKNLKEGLEKLAGKSPTYNGLELNISIFNEEDFWIFQLASGDNLMDHAICLYGEAKIPHKSKNDLLARNFSFGFIRFRQLLGMAAHVNNVSTESDDKKNLLHYFTKIPLNVSKGIQGCYKNITNNEELRKWFLENLNFDVDIQIEKSHSGNPIEAISSSTWATQEVMKFYNKELNICTPV